MKTQRLIVSVMAFFAMCASFAQWVDPVSFTVTQKKVSDTELVITFKGTIDEGWHVYSTDIGEGGPTPATFNIDSSSGVKLQGKLKAVGNVMRHMDPIFNMEVSYFENTCTFEQHLTITDKDYSLKGYLEYGACNDQNCTPPTSVDVKVEGHDGPLPVADETKAADTGEEAKADEAAEVAAAPADSAMVSLAADSLAGVVSVADNDLWADMTAELKALSDKNDTTTPTSETSLWWIFLMGMLGGLVALITPCVWPIIPMTVSFFLKRSEKKSRGVRDAIIYGLSIIVIYVSLGLAITIIFGASALNALSTNAIVNIFFFLLLVAFGISFLGVFEITLPSSWSNKTDQKAESTSGLISIFIMAFTLALVSFSCTGPIIGFMLVEVASMGNILGPFIGMLGFAIALALPFTIFAIFPTLLKKAPKSGSWMNTVKVVLGFIELAFALKFLSVADLAYGWHLLDREVFLIIWIILAVLLGLYLVGVLRLPIDGGKKPKRTWVKAVLALCSFAFAIYMIPGVFGKPLPAISAFAPPMYTQHIRMYDNSVEAKFRDYEEGMAYAQANNKPVLIDFTGFGCVNCREMEQKVWNDPEVARMLTDEIVLISLYVDDKTKLPQNIEVEENGKTTTLRTIGDKWSYLQRRRFGANAQPFYVLCDSQGHPLQPAYSFDTDPEKFLEFLKAATEKK